jgi:hypothetical protein
MKNPFKKQSIVDTIINVGIGGAANVAMDYVFTMLPADTVGTLEDSTKNIIKIAAGALAGSMISGKYARAAADGIATVGAANLIAGLITDDKKDTDPKTTQGVPFIGYPGRNLKMGQRGFKGRVGAVPFMG